MRVQKINISTKSSKIDVVTKQTLKAGIRRYPHIPVTYMVEQLVEQREKMTLQPTLYLAYVININNAFK